MKRLLVAALALGLLLPLAAQAGANQGAPSDPRLLALELGLPIGYSLSSSAVVSGAAFGLSIPVSDSFSVGISSTQVGNAAPLTAYNCLRLSYAIMPQLGTSLYIGQAVTTTPASAVAAGGLGLYTTLAQGKSAAGLVTALRLRVDYFFTSTSMASGSVVFTSAVLFGI